MERFFKLSELYIIELGEKNNLRLPEGTRCFVKKLPNIPTRFGILQEHNYYEEVFTGVRLKESKDFKTNKVRLVSAIPRLDLDIDIDINSEYVSCSTLYHILMTNYIFKIKYY